MNRGKHNNVGFNIGQANESQFCQIMAGNLFVNLFTIDAES